MNKAENAVVGLGEVALGFELVKTLATVGFSPTVATFAVIGACTALIIDGSHRVHRLFDLKTKNRN